MLHPRLSRRRILLSAAGFVALTTSPGRASSANTAIHVVKDPDCGCCGAWINILETAGFAVTVEHASPDDLMLYKRAKGVPEAMSSCHTADLDGYTIEGHVPVADLRRLMLEQPDAVGLAVPGMPWGSPGMGPEDEREAYDVFLIHRDGSTSVYSHYAAA